MTPMSIGRKLRALRGSLSRKEVADATGISVSALANYECGLRVPRDESKRALAIYYGVSVDELFYSALPHKSK